MLRVGNSIVAVFKRMKITGFIQTVHAEEMVLDCFMSHVHPLRGELSLSSFTPDFCQIFLIR
jgi:hypothetical protein